MPRAPAITPIFFFFNDTATTAIYTLSLHDALPILDHVEIVLDDGAVQVHVDEVLSGCRAPVAEQARLDVRRLQRSEEHTSELQSRRDLVCRLLLEKKKKTTRQVSEI